jgi:hypothetical protein
MIKLKKHNRAPSYEEGSESGMASTQGGMSRDAFGMPEEYNSSASSSHESSSNADEDEEFGMLANSDRLRPEREAPPAPPIRTSFHSQPAQAPPSQNRPPPPPDFMRTQNEHRDNGFVSSANDIANLDNSKLDMLHKIQRMAASGTPPQISLSMDSSFEQIQSEYQRMKHSNEITKSIKFQRRILLAASSGVEFLAKRAPFIKLRLEGYSEAVLDSISDYDSTFEAIHDKYGESVSVDPMWQLLFMFCSSIISFHISNAMFSSVLPSVTQTLSNNPEVIKQVAAAMASMAPQQAPVAPEPVVIPVQQQMQPPPPPSQAMPPMPPLHFPNTNAPMIFGNQPQQQQPYMMDMPSMTRQPPPPQSQLEMLPQEQDDDTRSVTVSEVSNGGTRRRRSGNSKKPLPANTLVF